MDNGLADYIGFRRLIIRLNRDPMHHLFSHLIVYSLFAVGLLFIFVL